jgi:hypothetical protein
MEIQQIQNKMNLYLKFLQKKKNLKSNHSGTKHKKSILQSLIAFSSVHESSSVYTHFFFPFFI